VPERAARRDPEAQGEAERETIDEALAQASPRVTPVVAVAAFVFDADGRVLLIERGKPPGVGLWTVPGGRIERGETLAQAVARELREETGLVAEVGPLVCVVERIADDYHFVILDYLARVVGGTLAAATDARAARFVDDAELSTLPVTDGLVEVLARARGKYATWASRS
jgi:ADP-ribose pyrophosphatase YjhB (NUDIX family)